MHAFLPTLIAVLAPGQLNPPSINVATKTYLVAAGKPTVEIGLPPSYGSKTGPLSLPSGPLHVFIDFYPSVMTFLGGSDTAYRFGAAIYRCDPTGKPLSGYSLGQASITGYAFPGWAKASGGRGYVDLTLSPQALTAVKFLPPRIPMPPSESRCVITGFDLAFKDKPASWADRIGAFTLAAAGTNISGPIPFESDSQVPAPGPVFDGRISLRYRVGASAEQRFNIRFKSATSSNIGVKKTILRTSQVSFD